MENISLLGSGWLGLALAEHLVHQGYKVNASTRTTKRFEAIQACAAIPFALDIDHLAGDIKVFLKTDILIINITSKNITGYKELISQIELSTVKKLIFVSSTSVYKNINAAVTESSGAENVDSAPYQIENLFRLNKCFQTTVIRFAGLIGHDRHPGRFSGNRKIPEPDAPVNLIHRDDCINIVSEIIQQDIWGEVFNACADTHPSKRDFYSLARQNLALPVPEFEESTDAGYKIVDNKKIKRVLGYSFIHADLMKIDL